MKTYSKSHVLVFAALTAMLAGMSIPVIAQPDALAGWNNKQIEGDWSAADAQWSGPVIADIDNDGAKEIIVADNRRIRVFDTDGDEIELDNPVEVSDDAPNLWDLGYKIRGIPTVGDVNGDGDLEIVYTISKDTSYVDQADHGGHVHDVPLTATVTELYVCDGTTGAVIAQTGCIGLDFGQAVNEICWIQAWTPVLADVDVIDFEEEDSYEDGRMEIILGGWGNRRTTTNIPPHQPPWVQPSGQSWLVYVILLDENDDLVLRARISDGLTGGAGAAKNDWYLLPAVGDMNNDGKKEIVLNSRDYIWIYTYDPSTQTLTQQAEVTRDGFPDDPTLFVGTGPVLADVNNDGELWAIVPHYNGFNEPRTKMFVIDIDGVEHQSWDGNNNAEMFTGYPITGLRQRESPIVFDNDADGIPDLIVQTRFDATRGRLYCRRMLNNAVFHIQTSVSVREWSDKVQMTDVGELGFSSRCLGFVVDSRHTLNGHLLLPGLSR